jgi:predicted RND superfamily exporter protein
MLQMTEFPLPVRLYDRAVLRHPVYVILFFAFGLLFFGYHLKNFRMDASSDSLVLENDADLKYYESTRELFGSDDYIILTLTAPGGVFSDPVLHTIDAISRDLSRLTSAESVNSILTVPLFESPKVSLIEMGSRYTTLLMDRCDRELARRELTSSPLWRNNLISEDGRTTALVLTLKQDRTFNDLRDERYRMKRRGSRRSISFMLRGMQRSPRSDAPM